jgi:cytochrome c oxidase subunit 4
MPTLKLYTAIYVVLFAFATAQVFVERSVPPSWYWIGIAVILILSVIKALLVVGYFQHLKFEPRSVTYIVLSGLLAALALTFAASYSIT